MASFEAIFIAGAIAVCAFSPACAADPDLPPAPPLEPAASAPIIGGGWYLRGDVGYGFSQISDFSSNDANSAIVPGFRYDGSHLGDHTIIGGGLGYQFNQWLRFDVTGEYHTPTSFSATESYSNMLGTDSDGYGASVRSSVFLANGYVDLGTWYGFTPFIGAGIGGAWNQIHHLQDVGLGPNNYGGYGIAPDRDSFEFA